VAKSVTDSAAQHARFFENARALGCDEDEAAFDEKLKAVVGAKKRGEDTAKAKPERSDGS